jgi:voltage-gated sodium channel
LRNGKAGKSKTVRAYGQELRLESHRVAWLSKFVYSPKFEIFIAFIILVNATALALLTMPGIDESTRAALEDFDTFALYIYVLELFLRVLSYGTKPWKFFRQGWNTFDFIIIILSLGIVTNEAIILRLLRIFRLIRIFRFLPEVRILTTSVVRSLPPLMSVSVLIFITLFMYGMAGYYLFGESLPEDWGSIAVAMQTLFILLTLENFPNYLNPALKVSPWALPFFLSYVFFVVFTVLNVLIGIVLNAMDQAREENQERLKRVKELDDVVSEVDEITSDGKVTQDEIERLRTRLRDLESRFQAEKG